MGISIENVSYTYQSGTPFERRALFDMTVTIKDGSYTAFIGHTGSGKSTIMQLLRMDFIYQLVVRLKLMTLL